MKAQKNLKGVIRRFRPVGTWLLAQLPQPERCFLRIFGYCGGLNAKQGHVQAFDRKLWLPSKHGLANSDQSEIATPAEPGVVFLDAEVGLARAILLYKSVSWLSGT
ncbi:MAG TPA: hypothetical protein PLH34_09120 [Bacillota bacterium]|jgi:hypothetical protein|nr:hypothetical protein [Bacillota bacterium]